jgi:alkylated DNA nucleotide flippase Atl1
VSPDVVAAAETSLQGLLEGAKQYQVPLYQRTYSWSKPQLSRLWDDILALAEDRADHPNATHFIGSLVLAQSPSNGPSGVSQFLVVDGQQRLTTVSILLCAIRDHRAQHESVEHRERLNQQYLINPYRPEQQRLKLVPTQADRGAYQACLDATPQAGGADPVGTAYRFFAAQLVVADDPDDPLDIQRIEDAVISGLALVSVTAQQGDNVHRIFESLNNTGLKLTQADLLRNYLFMRLPTRAEAVYQSLWLALQQTLSPAELELLFWLDLVHLDPRAKQSDIYAGQQARLDWLHTEEEIEAEVRRFGRLGALLHVILHPEQEKNPGVRLRLERSNAWQTTTVYSLLLHLLDRREQGTATSEQIAQAMLYVESFLVRRLVIGRATANINRILLSIVTEMDEKLAVDEAVRQFLSAGRKYYATNEAVRDAVGSIPYYLNGRPHQRNLVLRWLEESYGSKEPVAADTLTIEHLLPQSPTAEWRQSLAVDLGPEENVDEVHESLVHTLGNLTLTGYNSELSNSPFAVKRAGLARSGIRLNQEIAAQQRWGRPQIQTRAQALADRVISIWPGPTTQPGTRSEVSWDVMAKALAELPAGSWTTYGDLAALIGTAPQPLGVRLATYPAPNAHRVLQVEGVISPGFRWLEPGRTDDPAAILRAEGVEFDDRGRASQAQRIGVEELAQLAGLTPDELPKRLPRSRPGQGVPPADRFAEQLTALQGSAIAAATLTVIDGWTDKGGFLLYGAAGETSCLLMARDSQHESGDIWPATIYPSGKFEVVFQYLSTRPPFDDIALREELRLRLNKLPGVNLPAAKIALRPGFPLKVLLDPQARGTLLDQLQWFLAEAEH